MSLLAERFGFDENFVYVGCDSFTLTPATFAIRESGRTIEFDWGLFQGGGIALRDRQPGAPLPSGAGTIDEAMRRFATMRETHDALWMKFTDGVLIALIEREHPKREALLAGVQQRLGSHWFGDVFSSAELAQRFSLSSRPAARPMLSTPLLIMGGGMLLILVVAILLAVLR